MADRATAPGDSHAPACAACGGRMESTGWSHRAPADTPPPARVFRCRVCGTLWDRRAGYRPGPAHI